MKNHRYWNVSSLKRSVLTLLFGTIFFVPSAWAKIECVPARAQAALNILSPVGPVVGIANFVIDGEPSVASVVVNFLAPPEFLPNGTQRTLVKIDYDFGGGNTIVGIGIGTLTPTAILGVFSNDQQVTYVGDKPSLEIQVFQCVPCLTIKTEMKQLTSIKPCKTQKFA